MTFLTEKEVNVCVSLQWKVAEADNGFVELENVSPAGDDLVLYSFPDDTLYETVKKSLDSFDVDEHVELWIGSRGVNGVPGTVRELLDDAEAIREMLCDLERELRKVQEV